MTGDLISLYNSLDGELSESPMREFLNITKSLGDENRVRVLMALRHGELCLCHLIELLGLAPSTVSKHMSLLLAAGLVSLRKDGRWHYYAWAPESAATRAALEWMRTALAHDPRVKVDDKRLRMMSCKPREDFSVHYRTPARSD